MSAPNCMTIHITVIKILQLGSGGLVRGLSLSSPSGPL